MGGWGDGEIGRWGDREIGRWGDREMGRRGDLEAPCGRREESRSASEAMRKSQPQAGKEWRDRQKHFYYTV